MNKIILPFLVLIFTNTSISSHKYPIQMPRPKIPFVTILEPNAEHPINIQAMLLWFEQIREEREFIERNRQVDRRLEQLHEALQQNITQ
ncbi:hypothetical protein A3F06_03635 [candidate division TM6 bacterium RIFCSPHIGHO2_12_FULL_36_22]|nr:MAG: hypothetical protein A3F06_03635 [candidate division TM6 bacterium RIFCSPHIGHO2_12_FULL_36_22]